MKIDKFDFETKRKLMISINNSIIDESMDAKNVHKFDIIFSKISYEEFELDAYLYHLWSDIKRFIIDYYQKNKDLVNRFLLYINNQLNMFDRDYETDSIAVKKKDGSYGK